MTPPTQAQIEAWQKVVEQAMDCIRGETPEDVSFGEAEDDTYAKLRQVDAEMSSAITAAAQVGELPTEEYLEAAIARRTKLNEVVWKDAVADTIERCAQVASKYKGATNHTVRMHREICHGIAATIRKLKDAL